MPHDMNGALLQKGDRVLIPATVEQITSEGETYCNVTLRLDKSMAPEHDEEPYTMCLSARQCVLTHPEGLETNTYEHPDPVR